MRDRNNCRVHQLTVVQSVLGALAITIVLAGLHLGAQRIRKLPLVPETATGSFAGGLAVAYVFLHLVPEIVAGNEAIGDVLADAIDPTPLLELAIFLVALAGFTAFSGWSGWPRPPEVRRWRSPQSRAAAPPEVARARAPWPSRRGRRARWSTRGGSTGCNRARVVGIRPGGRPSPGPRFAWPRLPW